MMILFIEEIDLTYEGIATMNLSRAEVNFPALKKKLT